MESETIQKYDPKTKEGQRVYWVWADMVSRCSNPLHRSYKNYGGRGLTVSQEWQSSSNFIRDMWPRPENHTLDREDNSKGYSKENCKWVPRLNNNWNKRIYKCSPCGISGITKRQYATGIMYRVQIRFKGQIAFDSQSRDFFEACCMRKSAENRIVNPVVK